MTIIDTTLYANGALRLSRHGAGRGGNVLMHIASGAQCVIDDLWLNNVTRRLEGMSGDFALHVEEDFNDIVRLYANPSSSNERVIGGKLHKVIDHQIVPA
jgi:hypothetical protein